MPLHLLQKKSWHVYNTENVARVRRDEAEAQAREQAAEQLELEEDAQRRMKLLRGETVAPLLPAPSDRHNRDKSPDVHRNEHRGSHKRRRLRNEDDTDRDIRFARERTTAETDGRSAIVLQERERDAPLQDHAGHIQLFSAPDEKAIRQDVQASDKKNKKSQRRERDEQEGAMRFKDAAGYRDGMQKPWYAASTARPARSPHVGSTRQSTSEGVLAELEGKDVFGREDSRRISREQHRITTNDPFAAMQQAQKQLKQSAREKTEWQKARLAEVSMPTRRHRHDREREREGDKRSLRREAEDDDLENFSLDAGSIENSAVKGKLDRHRKHDRSPRRRPHHHSRRRASRSASPARCRTDHDK